MPLIVTAAEVEVCAELVRRLAGAAAVLANACTAGASLLSAVRFAGLGADACRREVHRLASAIEATGQRLAELAVRAAHQRDHLVAELTARRMHEAAVLEMLGRLTRVPGDLEAQLHGDLVRFRGNLPVSGHHRWAALHHTLISLLP